MCVSNSSTTRNFSSAKNEKSIRPTTQIFWCIKNVYCDWCGEGMSFAKHSEARQPPLVFAHKYFGKTSTRKLFICESKPSKSVYQILICENNLACSEINLTANGISPINHYLSAQGTSHPITLTLYQRTTYIPTQF